MDAQTCIKKLGYVGVLNFATVDKDGAPQVRNISAIHFEKDAIYFFAARGKELCKQLLENVYPGDTKKNRNHFLYLGICH